ncbi:hypothetical protein Bealeia2_02041 (plasmid) [Candidatus Bealeia paramacronuclearis]|uniref:hypothetical protein n=1 Tax=Candidatus Bealeia paramacronuclearis TaxID=1921001 RepID=UPI002C26249C|nr:hypothetical protein [Candidatus Bealeia paramacronuclearis]
MALHDEALRSPPSFQSPVMKKVAEHLAVIHMSNEERNTYFAYLKEAVHSQDVLLAASEKRKKRYRERPCGRFVKVEKGLEKGREEGREEGLEKEKLKSQKLFCKRTNNRICRADDGT